MLSLVMKYRLIIFMKKSLIDHQCNQIFLFASDPCPNGAAFFLLVAGIFLLMANLLNIVFKLFLVQAVKVPRQSNIATLSIFQGW